MRSIHLILGAYNSQAIDLVESDREILYEYSYKPFLKLLYNYEALPFTMYYSGPLIEWLEKHHSEFVDVLTEMVKSKRVELLGGAFYEPFLPLIPKADRIGQIERLTTYIRKCFGRRPRGSWIPGGIWDQRIAATLNTGGLEYAFLRDTTLRHHGALPDHLPLMTEDQGKTLVVLPVDSGLSKRLFRDNPAEIVSALRAIARAADKGASAEPSRNRPVVSLLFDGSRLGYQKEDAERSVAWFGGFLDEITRNSDWLSVGLPGRVVKNDQPMRRIYAPASPLSDLTDWVLPYAIDGDAVDADGDLTQGFRSIMERYPESARLYARMQHTHVLVNQVRGDKYRKMTAREELWRGQSHYAYWHNRSGGVYHANLRKATYSALIEAEKTTRERGIFIPAMSRIDVDLDGEDEILYQGNEINAYIDRRGGHLFELDYLRKNWNYLDTFQRRPEPFHDEATKSAGYDESPRSAFVDHLLPADATLQEFSRGGVEPLCSLLSLAYRIQDLDKDHNTVSFSAGCMLSDGLTDLEIEKTFRFTKNRIDVEYRIANTGMEKLSAVFATEVNLSFFSLDVGKLRLHARQGRSRREIPPDAVELKEVSDLQYQDLHNNTLVTLNPSDRPGLWCFPVEAVGILWDHPHWFYQSNCSLFRWLLALDAGEQRELSISLRIDPAKGGKK